MTTPRALQPFMRLPQALRGAGFAVSPDQTIDFIEGVGLLGPRDMTDIWRAGRALFSIPQERLAEYDAIFRAVFLDQVMQGPIGDEDDDEVEAYEPTGDVDSVEAPDDESEVGAEATVVERLGQRSLGDTVDAALDRIKREASRALPRRVSYRRSSVKKGDRLDMRRTLREAVKRDGDVLRLWETKRALRQRRVLLLIDVSGSMKDRSEAMLRLAHAVVQAADRSEVFTLGTRLTRITESLKPADRSSALSRASAAVADFDGGTRIGEALSAYLAVPRFAGFARGAAVVVLSDGLERGSPAALIDAANRLSRLAWRFDWLTPLAADPEYTPATEGLSAILPMIGHLGSAANTTDIADHILTMARAA
ncbi:VWA domain-containing protein [Rhodobacteraceae bacterium]|nr:VWA domain-containing protein [Paracoccaceae bacterium]